MLKLKIMKKILFYAWGVLLPITVCLAVYSYEKPNEDPTVMANIEVLTDTADSPWPNKNILFIKELKDVHIQSMASLIMDSWRIVLQPYMEVIVC